MNEPLDLDSCAREPIHIPGGIQPHGVLLAVAPDSFRVLQASANAADILGLPALPTAVADLPPGEPSLEEELRTWLAGDEPLFLRSIVMGGTAFHVSAHETAQCVLVEFEAVAAAEMERFDRLMPRLRRFLDGIENVTELDQLHRESAAEIRRMTGFNRVLIYRFDDEWNGTVIAEDSDGTLPSYMDLRFPASDIPVQARELYRRNRLRLIPTANYEAVPMVPPLLDGEPLDMSAAALRSVSPVHREYMRNMGTEASMSISLLDDGKLWGLISCHDAGRRVVSPQVRAACDFLGRIVAQRITSRERTIEASARLDLKQIETELVARLSRAESYQTGLVNNPRPWMQLTGAQGAAVVSGDTVLTVGDAPSSAQVLALARWLGRHSAESVFATDQLAACGRKDGPWPTGPAG